jgi:hypothetical protein
MIVGHMTDKVGDISNILKDEYTTVAATVPYYNY